MTQPANTDPLLDLVDQVVAMLSGILGDAVKVEWPVYPVEKLDDAALAKPLLWVLGMSRKGATDAKSSVPYEDYTLLLVYQQKLGTDRSTDADTVRELAGVIAQLEDLLRPLDADGPAVTVRGDRVACREIHRVTQHDYASLVRERRYYAELLTTWRRW